VNRKFSIVKKIDMNELDKMIDEYQCFTGEMNPYLFMNKRTVDAIATVDDNIYCPWQIRGNVNGITGYYHGYKVFRDDSLDFGDVEIR